MLEAVARGKDLEVFVFCAAVGVDHRWRGGETANRLIDEVVRECRRRARDAGCETMSIRGKIGVQNAASQFLAKRFGLEPDPEYDDFYQYWFCTVAVDA
ncbi:hypothetical protein GCM10023217_16870 [Gordonia alkaliphila]|uniref:GNAT family N-acetyltransferase n=2 Tax=Gordonia alkaliphila TaxID=1053547 RepID=A0ABP8Z6L1_9ACTN